MKRKIDNEAAIVGRKVIEGLEKGHQRAVERAKQIGAANALQVMTLAMIDAQAGHSIRGRSARIAKKLGGLLKERSVRKILVRLYSRADSLGHNQQNFNEVSQ